MELNQSSFHWGHLKTSSISPPREPQLGSHGPKQSIINSILFRSLLLAPCFTVHLFRTAPSWNCSAKTQRLLTTYCTYCTTGTQQGNFALIVWLHSLTNHGLILVIIGEIGAFLIRTAQIKAYSFMNNSILNDGLAC